MLNQLVPLFHQAGCRRVRVSFVYVLNITTLLRFCSARLSAACGCVAGDFLTLLTWLGANCKAARRRAVENAPLGTAVAIHPPR